MLIRRILGMSLLVVPYIFVIIAFEVSIFEFDVMAILTIFVTMGLALGTLSLRLYKKYRTKISYWYISFIIGFITVVLFVVGFFFASGWDAFGYIMIGLIGILFLVMMLSFYLLIYDNKIKKKEVK